MSAAKLILHIAVPSPLYRTFDYLPPKGTVTAPRPGTRVLVPFGRQRVVGVVLDSADRSDLEGNRLKRVLEILDEQPVLGPDMLQLVQWAAQYYQYPPGDALATALPVLMRKASGGRGLSRQWWRLTAAGRATDAGELARAPRQASVLAQLHQHAGGLPREDIDAPFAVLRALRDKGWIEPCEPAPASVGEPGAAYGGDGPPLSEAQQAAVAAIREAGDRFHAFLLEGVTGSGKTEVYLQAIEPVVRAGRQVLVLVPEIGLTPQLVRRFEKRLGMAPALLHSGLSDGERLHAWQQAARGERLLVIGTRSAVFTPLARPGLVIVDEEHDPSLKQQDGFRYSARDLAVWRARQAGVPVVLGSATPSLESLYNAELGRYRHLLLPERAGSAALPRLQLLDVRRQPMQDLLSEPLVDRMSRHLSQGGQVLVFLNRRGFAPVLLCHDCGWVADCPRCDAHMTLHRRQGRLRCHHCGHQRRIDTHCPGCGSSELVAVGQGTERLEQALAERFPGHRVLRIDRDTTRGKGSLQQALDSARSGEARILLGTQMLAKGHHFPGVTLVAILDADQGLFGSDFRASERMAQLIVQVAGRAGRGDQAGEVLIQTHQPDHPLLRQLVAQGYDAFARAALAERRAAQLPPYSSLALLRAEAPGAEAPMAFLEQAARLASALDNGKVQLWGPVPAPMERRAGRYRAQLLLQADRRSDLQQMLKRWLPQLQQDKTARRVRWSIDVDPVDML